MSKGALGLLAAYWPEGTARYAHVPLERSTQYCVHRTAAAEADRPALVTPSRTIRYGELSRETKAGASVLSGRVSAGARIAILADDPAVAIPCLLATLEADCTAWLAGAAPDAAALSAFAPALVVGDAPPPGHEALAPAALREGDPEASRPRPNLRNPVLALPAPGGRGEVLHNHKTLVSTAIAFGSFFLLEPGAELVLLEPPDHWLALAALLGSLHKGACVRAAYGPEGARLLGAPCHYAVSRFASAEERYLGATPTLRDLRIGVGAILGIEGPFRVSRRRQLARRLGTAALAVLGRNDLGPVIASHPTWYLDAAAGIPLPNVDAQPLDPSDGRRLAIGWDAVEEAELGVKSSLAPAGGELVNEWLRSRWRAHTDPTGLYFLADRPLAIAPGA